MVGILKRTGLKRKGQWWGHKRKIQIELNIKFNMMSSESFVFG